MKENTQEKGLVQANKNSIFYKIKRFFKKLFTRKESNFNNSFAFSQIEDNMQVDKNKKNSFMKEIRNIEDEETKLLKLQKQYDNGEIKEEELSEEQVKSLCDLYDKQIANLRKSNEMRKQKLLEYSRKLQTDN